MSKEIQEKIRTTLEANGFELTPTMMDPNTFQPSIGILVEEEAGTRLGYVITINEINKQELKNGK
jgi:hypothetical protein